MDEERRLCYVGDTIDDARCARLAGVPFIGIAAVKNTRLTELEHVLRKEGAAAILRDVNEIEKVLAQ